MCRPQRSAGTDGSIRFPPAESLNRELLGAGGIRKAAVQPLFCLRDQGVSGVARRMPQIFVGEQYRGSATVPWPFTPTDEFRGAPTSRADLVPPNYSPRSVGASVERPAN